MYFISNVYRVDANGTYNITAKAAILTGILVGVDGTNDTDVTVYDGLTASAGTEIVPNTPLDASAYGFNGFVNFPVNAPAGLTVRVANLGTGQVIFYYRVM